MKKLILSLAMVAAGAAAYAQISQGSLMIGGSVGFSSAGGGESKVTPAGGGASVTSDLTSHSDWNFSPAVGYFITDKMALGLRLGIGSQYQYQVTSTDGKSNENVNAMMVNVELFGRYYKELGSNFYLFGDLGLGYGSMSYTNRVADPASASAFKDGSKVSGSIIGVNFAPGLAFFPNEKWGVDFTLNRILGFNMNSSTNEAPNNGGKTETSTSDFNIGVGLTPTLGLHYYFGK